jgi:hypothetical protein
MSPPALLVLLPDSHVSEPMAPLYAYTALDLAAPAQVPNAEEVAVTHLPSIGAPRQPPRRRR